MDGSAFGLGTRSQRYAMVIDDGVVTTLNIESAPGTIEASGADAVLATL
jgi:peroxiredoxin